MALRSTLIEMYLRFVPRKKSVEIHVFMIDICRLKVKHVKAPMGRMVVYVPMNTQHKMEAF